MADIDFKAHDQEIDFKPIDFQSDEKSYNPTTLEGAKNLTLDTLGSGAKTLDYQRGAVTAPIVGSIISKLSGKDVYTPEEQMAALNPLNNKPFPSLNTMLGRAGVPEGAKLSDYVPGYSEKSESNPWYVPEKGGMLDPSVRGTLGSVGDMLIDPLTYETMGLGSLAKKELAADVASQVAKSSTPELTALKMSENLSPKPLGMAGKIGTAVNESLAKPLITPFSSAAGATGKTLYNSLLQPVLAQGLKFGKENVSDILRNSGVMFPSSLTETVSHIKNNLMKGRNAIAEQAASHGASPSMERALEPAQNLVNERLARLNPESQSLANSLQANINQRKSLLGGSEAIPAVPEVLPSTEVFKGPLGENILRDVPGKPGSPGVPAVMPKQKTPLELLNDTSDVYQSMPNTAYNQAIKDTLDTTSKKALAKGLNKEAIGSIGAVSGEKAASNADKLNKAYGELASTKQGQITAENSSRRLANNIVSPTEFADKLSLLAGSHGGPNEMLRNFFLSKAMNGARYGTMPTGYALDALSKSSAAPVVDTVLRNYFKNKLTENGGQ